MDLNQLRKTLVLDIETASTSNSYAKLGERERTLWRKKSKRLAKLNDHLSSDVQQKELYNNKAAVFAEFSKVICISLGYFNLEGPLIKYFRVKSIYSKEEKEILVGFANILDEFYFDKYNHRLAGHNIKEFDIPFICRRMIINEVPLPNLLRLSGARPWQTPHLLDTLELWKFGDYKNYSSLDLLCSILDIPSPKDKMDGSEVSLAFWEGRLEEIKAYCEKDLIATARVLLRLTTQLSFNDDQIDIVN